VHCQTGLSSLRIGVSPGNRPPQSPRQWHGNCFRVGIGPRHGDVPPGFIGETLLLGQERGHEAHIDVRALEPAAPRAKERAKWKQPAARWGTERPKRKAPRRAGLSNREACSVSAQRGPSMTHKGRPGAWPGGLWDELPAHSGSIHRCADNDSEYLEVSHMSAFLSFSTSAARCGGPGVARALYWSLRSRPITMRAARLSRAGFTLLRWRRGATSRRIQ
jgi:hypothetical protein